MEKILLEDIRMDAANGADNGRSADWRIWAHFSGPLPMREAAAKIAVVAEKGENAQL